jgi:fatty acid desaturase
MAAYLVSIIFTLGYFNLLKYLIILWIIPLFTIFPIIGWFVELSEHYPLVDENKVDLYMTRNRFSHYTEAFIFSIHCENFHLVHHLHPGIPFWNLQKAHRILLKDEQYKNVNMKMGGLFFSSNNQQSFIASIVDQNRELFSVNQVYSPKKFTVGGNNE